MLLVISCQDNYETKPIVEKLPTAIFTTLDKEPDLSNALDQVGLFLDSRKSGRLMSGITLFESDSILKVVQADSLEYSYTIALQGSSNSRSFKNLVFSRYSDGFLAYVLEYTSNQATLSYEAFNGSIAKYNLEGTLLDEVSVSNTNLSNSESRTMACFADWDVICVSGGGISTATGLPLPCLRWEPLVTITCDNGSSGGSGGATGGWHNLGTYIPDPYGGPGAGGGGGTPPSGDPNFEGSVGVLPPTLTNEEAINMVLSEDSFFLIDLPCAELPKWQQVATHHAPQSVIDKLTNLSSNQNLWSVLIPYFGWRVQDLNEAEGTVVNMDYYSVTVNQLPGGETAPQFLDYIRKNINSFIDPTKAQFDPFDNSEYTLWNSSNYLGSIIHIDMENNNNWSGGLHPSQQPDDGSVICTKTQSDHWIFTTITAPGDGEHPVSDNRQFGYIQNRNGSYTFFTRGVDRATGHIDNLVQQNLGTVFTKADELWTSFQQGISNYVNSHGGVAVITPDNKITAKPNWDKVRDYLNYNATIDVFGCK